MDKRLYNDYALAVARGCEIPILKNDITTITGEEYIFSKSELLLIEEVGIKCKLGYMMDELSRPIKEDKSKLPNENYFIKIEKMNKLYGIICHLRNRIEAINREFPGEYLAESKNWQMDVIYMYIRTRMIKAEKMFNHLSASIKF
ncbi:MAG: hypothetical protein ACRC3I_11825 [Cetobacterium sp.]